MSFSKLIFAFNSSCFGFGIDLPADGAFSLFHSASGAIGSDSFVGKDGKPHKSESLSINEVELISMHGAFCFTLAKNRLLFPCS